MSFVTSAASKHNHDDKNSSSIAKVVSSVDPDVADKAEQRSNIPAHVMMENEKNNKRATAYSTTATTNSLSKINKRTRFDGVTGSPSLEQSSLQQQQQQQQQQQVTTLLSPSLFFFEEEDPNDDSKLQQQNSDSWQEKLNELEYFSCSHAVAVASLNPFATVFQDDDHEEATKHPKNETLHRQKTPTDQLFQLAILGSWSEFVEHCEIYPQDAQWWTPLLPLFIHDGNHGISGNTNSSKKMRMETSPISSENKQQRQQQNHGTLLHYLLQLCHNGEGGGSGGEEDDEDMLTRHSYHHTTVSLPTPPYSAFEVLVKAYPSAVVIQSSLWKRTPLHDAIDSNSVSRPIFRLLLETSNQYIPPTLVELQSILSSPPLSSISPKQKQEESPASLSSSSQRQSLLPCLPLEIVQDYIYPYANIQPLEIQDWKGNTPLHLFFKKSRETYGSQKLVRDLIDECPQALRLTNSEGKTPIHQAILSNASPYQFEMLIDAYPQVLLLTSPLSVTTTTTTMPKRKVTSSLQSNNNGDDGNHERGASPLHYYLQHHIIQGKNYTSTTRGETLHTVRLLAGTCPEVLTMKDRDDKTPLRLLQDYYEFDGFAMYGNHRQHHNHAFEDRDEGIVQDCIQLLERLLLETTPNSHS